ncbi:hypothetical protein B0H13DRAFT_2308215 [Mycena leptocephala]|nr:hypothetical protein B0H13DRAFT_2308215 [Mycena leptocephala]
MPPRSRGRFLRRAPQESIAVPPGGHIPSFEYPAKSIIAPEAVLSRLYLESLRLPLSSNPTAPFYEDKRKEPVEAHSGHAADPDAPPAKKVRGREFFVPGFTDILYSPGQILLKPIDFLVVADTLWCSIAATAPTASNIGVLVECSFNLVHYPFPNENNLSGASPFFLLFQSSYCQAACSAIRSPKAGKPLQGIWWAIPPTCTFSGGKAHAGTSSPSTYSNLKRED